MCRHSTGFNPDYCSWCIAERKGKQTVSTETGCGSNGLGINGVNGFKHFKYEDNSNFWATIGFLAKHAKIVAEVLITNKEKFIEEYAKKKGHAPSESYVIEIKCQRTWGHKYYIHFPSWENVDLGNITPINQGSHSIASSMDLVLWLLDLGFELGITHDVEEIRSNVPEKFVEDFDLGTILN